MGLQSIHIHDFRCVREAQLEFAPDLTVIHGANGSGKSSLLEAIYLLGRGRSFRTNHLESAIRSGTSSLRVVGRVERPNETRAFVIGIEGRLSKTTARIDGQPAPSLAALSVAFPVQVIEPGVHKLIEEGPVRRRRYLDWGVFHVEQTYLDTWQRFHRLVRQRNAALKGHAGDAELDAWDEQFVAAGEGITRARSEYVAVLRPYVAAASRRLLAASLEVEVDYEQGHAGPHLATTLADARPRDRRRKVTTVGPHRADLVVRVQGNLARDTVSRGQQKLLAAALVMGQLAYHGAHSGMRPTILLDDPSAELDQEHLERLMAEVGQLKAQVIATSLQRDLAPLGKPQRAFHVEHGGVQAVT